jgi:hypothetical protein
MKYPFTISSKKTPINQNSGGALREKYAGRVLKTFSSEIVRSIAQACWKQKYVARWGILKVTNSKLHIIQRSSFEMVLPVKSFDE